MQLKSKQFRVFLILTLIALLSATALYGAVRIGGWAFSANGQLARNFQYEGGCPVDLKFDWGVIETRPGTIAYNTTRSDGAHAGARTLNHPGGNRSVPIVETWRLGANTPAFANYHGWMELKIESPNPVEKRIDFTIHCR